MKVVCENCGAVYKIPEQKLVKDVNKATCRKCGHRMLIRRTGDEVPDAPRPETEEQTLVASAASMAEEPKAPPRVAPPPPAAPVALSLIHI